MTLTGSNTHLCSAFDREAGHASFYWIISQSLELALPEKFLTHDEQCFYFKVYNTSLNYLCTNFTISHSWDWKAVSDDGTQAINSNSTIQNYLPRSKQTRQQNLLLISGKYLNMLILASPVVSKLISQRLERAHTTIMKNSRA